MKLNCKHSGKPVYRMHQAGKVLPLVLIAVAAMVVGAATFSLLSDQPNAEESAAQPSSNANNTELAALQENLLTSLAFPSDFRSIPEFDLLDVNSQSITQDVFDDQWSLVFFGFTHCPDVCPITLQLMKNVVASVEEQGQQTPQIVFVSIDPARDTADILKKYIGYFSDDFVGITGDVNDIHEFSRSLGIVASFTANETDPDRYGVDHTASLLLVDPQGRVRAKITPPHEAPTIVADYLTILSAPS